jgi:site-specific recombinase XerC
MLMSFFSSRGWESWDLEHRPLIPERMPVLIDDDLLFEDGPGARRPIVAVNRWLRELPVSGAPAPSTWETYARIVKEWMEFLADRGVGVFASRERLRVALSGYAEHRATGPVGRRFAASTWNQHMSVLASFYRWAMAEGHALAEPFSYRTAQTVFAGIARTVRVNQASRRRPKPHVTVRYLEPDFTAMFLNGLAGLGPDGAVDRLFHGRELARNACVGGLAVATGLRLQEFTYLLACEVPGLPRWRTAVPIAFPVPAGVTKGRKFRTTWISYDALAAVRQYLQLDRAATVEGSAWSPPPAWGEPLLVTDADERGGRINGVRCRWETLTPSDRRRLVAPVDGLIG